MSLIETCEFESIINDITNHEKFCELKQELHHGISRYEHSLRVAKMTYKVTKKFHLDYERVTRAALLHDFYTNEQTKEYNIGKTFAVHPNIALINAKKYFDLDKKQQNIIASHMFPVCNTLPKYKESYIVTCMDKMVAFHEMYRYKISLMMGIYLIFLFNMITIQK